MKKVLTAGERVKLARSPLRPRAKEYIQGIFDDFINEEIGRASCRERV